MFEKGNFVVNENNGICEDYSFCEKNLHGYCLKSENSYRINYDFKRKVMFYNFIWRKK